MKKRNLILTMFFALMMILSAGFIVPKNSAYAVNRTYTYIISTNGSTYSVSKRDNSNQSQTSITTEEITLELAFEKISNDATVGKETLVYLDNITLSQNLEIPLVWSSISGTLNLNDFSVIHAPTEAGTILTFDNLTINSTSNQSPILVNGETSLTFNVSNTTIVTPENVEYAIYFNNPKAIFKVENKIKFSTTYLFNIIPEANTTIASSLDVSEQPDGVLPLLVPHTADGTPLIKNCQVSNSSIKLVTTADFYTAKVTINNGGLLYIKTQIKTTFNTNGGTLAPNYTTTGLDYNSSSEILFPSQDNLTLAHNTLNGFLGTIELDGTTYYFDKEAITAFAATGYDETQVDSFFFTDPTEANSYFTYYKQDSNKTDPSYLAIEYFISQNKPAAFIADWSESIYTLSFNSDGGTAINSESGVYGTVVDLTQESKIPTKTGHTFKHWIDENSNTYSSTISIEKNTNLTAVWETNNYLLTIILDNGSENIEVLVPYNKPFSNIDELNATYTKEGYLFSQNNWVSTDTPPITYTSANRMPAHNVTVTAQWTIQTYIIKLYYNNIFNNSMFDTRMYYYGTDITACLSQEPEVEGFTFVGNWYEDKNGQSIATYTTMPAKNLELYAYWMPNYYTLTFYRNNVKISQQDNLRRGNVINSYIPEDPVIDGFVFEGWFIDSEFTTEFNTNVEQTMPASNLNIYAKISEKKVVTIDAPKQTYEKSDFIRFYLTTNALGCTVEYYVDGKWTTTQPTEAGTYDIRISRAEDATYKAFSQIIEGALTITPNTINISSIYVILYAVFIVEVFTILFVLVMRKRKQSLTPLSVVLPFGIVPTSQFVHLIIASILAITGFVILVIELVKLHRVNIYEDTRSDEEKQEELNARIKDVSSNASVEQNVDDLLKKEGFIDKE